MLLAIDARNGAVTFGFRSESSWLLVRRFGAAPDRTSDEYALLVGSAAEEASRLYAGDSTVQAAWISSVVPGLTPSLVEAVYERFGVAASVVGPGTKTGVKIRTDFPSEVGSDLVCAAVAAHELAGGPCLVVDAGAVLTVSALSGAGDFLGVAIAPGLRTAADSLRAVAAQIPEVRLEAPPRAIGRSTVQSVQAGVVLGYRGLVRGLVEAMGAELAAAEAGPSAAAGSASRPALIGSGEAASRAFLASCGIERFVPELVLEGLARIARNASDARGLG